MTKLRTSRRLRAATGAALIALGLGGVVTFAPTSFAAEGDAGSSHEVMHEMMDVMHGEGAAARMHEIEGAEQMMDACAQMGDAMGGMGNMSNMMGRGGMGGMMRGMS